MRDIRWGWVAAGGFLAELALSVVVAFLILVAGEESLDYAMPPASFVATCVLGWWVARKVQRRHVLHGGLVGLVAVVILVAMTFSQPHSIAYILAYVLKVTGGAAGGFVALKRSTVQVGARGA